LTRPTNTVEVGIQGVSKDSYKYGEYNGLQKQGVTAIGNIDLRGGGAWDSNDPTRWRVTGTDLGLETRNLSVEYGQQGKFRVNFGYDELRRNRSDSYQTPYNGSGSSSLTLPSNWIVPIVPQNNGTALNARAFTPSTGLAPGPYNAAGVATAPTAGNTAAVNAVQTADLPAFHNVDIHTKRTAIDGGLLFNIDRQWDIQASARHEKKDGLQLMGTVSRVSPSTGGSTTDASATIPYLIDQDTDQFNASVNFKGESSFFQAAYYGSVFKDNVTSMSWQNWQTGSTVTAAGVGPTAHPFATSTESTAPSNQFHQFSLTGGYNFDRNTKLVANGSYGRNTQNSSFLTDATTPVVPASSLNGLVVSKAFGLKLTAKPVRDLNVSAGYKYDLRDNRTAVNTYQYADAGEPAAGYTNLPGTVAQNANANRAYSKKLNQFNLDADYAFAKGQGLKAGLEAQKTDRWCNGAWIDCVDAATTKENTLRAEYRNSMLENLTGRIGYAYSARRVNNYNENAFLALVPYANVVPTGQTISAYQALLNNGLNGWGPALGYNGGTLVNGTFFPNNNALANALYGNNNRISELPGMRRYNMADRNRDKVRSSLNWQANEQLSFQGGVDFNNDDYKNSAYGLQKAKSWALNLDSTFAASENLSLTAYYTYEDQSSVSAGNNYAQNNNGTGANGSVNGQTAVGGGCYATVATRNQNNKLDPCENWSLNMKDKIDTLGLNVRHKGLASGRLDMAGDLTFTQARTNYGTAGGVYANNPFAVAGVAANTITAAYYIPAADLPEVKTTIIGLRVTGKYMLDKSSAVRVGYSFQRMKTTDYAYAGMQYGTLATVLPTSEQSPNYTVHSLGAAYIYSFK
jgi:MtrB/PioB family decaheme-associated outer membrane protein